MNRQIFNYAVYPSILPADTESTIRIHPLGENTQFVPGVTYTIEIRSVETFCSNYAHLPFAVYHVKPNDDGDLEITHLFIGEQRHAITLRRPQEDLDATPHKSITYRSRRHENTDALLQVFSLHDDLYGTRCFKGEVHCHTYESDGIQDVAHTVGNYRCAGYDFMAITDHYITMSSEKAMDMMAALPIDMTILRGEECHVPTEQIHAVHIGGRESVNAYFRNNLEQTEREVAAIEASLTLPSHINTRDYAWRVWIARKAREFGGLSILAHPHWIWYDTYFMASAITQQLLTDGVYDALDITDQEADTTLALWAEMQAQGHRIPVVGCTDSHYTDANNPRRPARGGYTLAFARNRDTESILDAIRSGRSIAVNAAEEPARVFGPYRLVKYARFLLDHYYPIYMRLCHGQGVVLSDLNPYTTPDEETLRLLSSLNKRSEEFAHAFFGY